MIDLPDAERKAQEIPTMEEMQKFLSALCYEEPVFQLFYFLAINTGMRRGELCALRWSDVIVTGSYEGYIIVQHSRSTVSGEGVQEGKTKNGRTRTVSMNEEMFSLLRGFCYRKMRLRDESGIPFPEYIFTKDDGTPIHPDTFSKHLKALFAEIGLPKTYHLHTLRHFLSRHFCMRAWTKTRSQTSPGTATRPSSNVLTATRRCSSSRRLRNA